MMCYCVQCLRHRQVRLVDASGTHVSERTQLTNIIYTQTDKIHTANTVCHSPHTEHDIRMSSTTVRCTAHVAGCCPWAPSKMAYMIILSRNQTITISSDE